MVTANPEGEALGVGECIDEDISRHDVTVLYPITAHMCASSQLFQQQLSLDL